jgi:HEAT repeat protein
MRVFKIIDEPPTGIRYGLLLFLLFLIPLYSEVKDEFKEQILDSKPEAISQIFNKNRLDLFPILRKIVQNNSVNPKVETAILKTYSQFGKELPVIYPTFWEDLEFIIENSKNEENILLSLEITSTLKEKRFLYAILDLITNRNSTIRRMSYQVLNSFKDDRSLPYILELGNSEEPIKRYYYLEALNFIGDERANIHLQRLLQDPSPAIRSEAILAIEKLGLKEKLNSVLAMATNDSNYEVRKFAVVSLKNQKNKFQTTVFQKTIFDSNIEVRDVSLDAIQNTKDPNYGKFVSLAMEKESESFLSLKMIDTLLALNNHGGGNGLSFALKKDPDIEVRTKAAFAIGNLKATSAIPDLISSLKLEPIVKVKLESTRSLGILKEKKAVPVILTRLQTNEPTELKLEFLTALDKIDDPKVMPVIFDLTEEENQKNIRPSLKSLLRKMLYRYHGGDKTYKLTNSDTVSNLSLNE